MLRVAMARWKHLIDRAKQLASEHLPQPVLDAGRKLLDEVAERAPGPLAEALQRRAPEEAAPSPAPSAVQVAAKDRTKEALERVLQKADHGLKPEDRLVVIYATSDETQAVSEIREALEGIETTIREMDLRKEPPQTATQLAKLTNVMVPPYVYINGRFWGAQYEMMSLRASGDLEHVVANRIDLLSEGAKRLGKIHDAYSEDITVENILHRWKLGHILCVDDLDSWYELGKAGKESFYYQGGPRPVADMPEVAAEIASAVEAGTYDAQWRLEPAIQLME